MITLLHIENIAVIEKADIEFDAGLNVLTGETGAGKSIIIDSINALLGERTSRDIIRSGCEGASVTAVFSGVSELVAAKLQQLDLPSSEDGLLYISRSLRLDGKNICRINSSPIALSVLREIGGMLVNIHGQHDNQRLLDPASHLLYLDNFSSNDTLIDDFRKPYYKMQEVKRKISELSIDESQKARKIEMLASHVEEISAAKLVIGEEEELAAKRQIAIHASRVLGAINDAYFALYGSDDISGACALLKNAAESINGVTDFGDALLNMYTRLNELSLLADDCVLELRDAQMSFDVTPDELDRLESRLDLIYKLKKKYGTDVGEILDYLEKSKSELNEIETSEQEINKLSEEFLLLRQQASEAAKLLSVSRHESALRLEKDLTGELTFLNMEKARFEVSVQNNLVDGKIKLSPTGIDRVEFLISVNPGEDVKPLAKTASGGELSRIMLALKNVLVNGEQLSALIFDEIDSGISGLAAQKVGQKLSSLSKNIQVLCVTHLAQIAARADHHFLIEKLGFNDRTRTTVTKLDFDGRKNELARIISGSLSETSLKAAEEMLKKQ